MVSDGSCDTEDWSNDAENSALITGINYFFKYIKVEIIYFNYDNILLHLIIFLFYCCIINPFWTLWMCAFIEGNTYWYIITKCV